MKHILTSIILSLAVITAWAQTTQDSGFSFTEASSLTMVGKLMTDTPNPYHRVDTVKFKGFTNTENGQVRMSSGLAVAFKTNSKTISVKTEYGLRSFPTNTNGIAARGYDLYFKKDGKWMWAASGVTSDDKPDANKVLIKDMDNAMHECLMYLPLYSEEYSIKIGTETGSTIEAIDNPFRYRIGIFGSSFTHGSSTSRAGLSYPAQFSRMTGLQMLSLGCSGNCKMQSYFADVLCAADVDAFVFDSFSNPTWQQINERLFPFIEKIQAAHPGTPLIFQRTIRREELNYNTAKVRQENKKWAAADSMMKIAVKKYDDVYYVTTTSAELKSHETSVDGVHPTNYGYTLWMESISKPVRKILRKYGIK